MQTLTSTLNRRTFLQRSSLATAFLAGAPYLLRAQGANEKLNIAVIGAGGKGASDTDSCARKNIVALGSGKKEPLKKRATKYPGAKLFRVYRRMREEMKNI